MDQENTPSVPTSPHRWRRIAAITAVALVVAELGAWALEPLLPSPNPWPTDQTAVKANQIMGLAAAGSSVDAVFLGSSVVVEGIDPLAFNGTAEELTGYNAALDGASMKAAALWAEEFVLPSLDPRVVVVGITTRDLNDGGTSQEEFFRSLSASRGLRDIRLQTGLWKWVNEVSQTSALLRLRPVLRQPGTILRHLMGQTGPSEPSPGPFGSEPLDETAFTYNDSESWHRLWRTRHFDHFAIGGEELSALEGLIGSALAQGREVVLVEMPVHNDYVKSQPGGEAALAELHEVLTSLAQPEGVHLISPLGAYGPEDFRDPAHLNPEAAEQLAVDLASYVAAVEGLSTASEGQGPTPET